MDNITQKSEPRTLYELLKNVISVYIRRLKLFAFAAIISYLLFLFGLAVLMAGWSNILFYLFAAIVMAGISWLVIKNELKFFKTSMNALHPGLVRKDDQLTISFETIKALPRAVYVAKRQILATALLVLAISMAIMGHIFFIFALSASLHETAVVIIFLLVGLLFSLWMLNNAPEFVVFLLTIWHLLLRIGKVEPEIRSRLDANINFTRGILITLILTILFYALIYPNR